MCIRDRYCCGQKNDAVILFFSVNESRGFQGYAKMMSTSEPGGMGSVADIMGNTMGGSFKLKWQTIYDLSFDETYALKNPYSDNRPLKISRDGEQACRSTHSIYRRRAK